MNEYEQKRLERIRQAVTALNSPITQPLRADIEWLLGLVDQISIRPRSLGDAGQPNLPRVDEVPRGSFYCRGCQAVVRMRHCCPGLRRGKTLNMILKPKDRK